jgi:methionine sulfoxide reductase heme-binding subunit
MFAASKIAWYVSRSSGLMAWIAVTASMLWGLALSTRLVRMKGAPAWILDLHRFLGVLSVVFTAVHMAGLVADSFVHFGIADLLVPMASSWKPAAVASGVVAMYMVVAIQVSSWMRTRLPRKVWRGIHMLSFPLFGLATLHGFQAGADNHNVVVVWGAVTGAMLLVFFIGARIGIRQHKRPRVSA